MSRQRMSPAPGNDGGGAPAGDSWFEDFTIKLGGRVSFQALGAGGSAEIGLTDVGKDSFADPYVSFSGGGGFGAEVSADVVGSVVMDSEQFAGQSTDVGASGGFLGDVGAGASWPDGSDSALPNSYEVSVGVGAGGAVEVQRSDTTVWDGR